LFNCITGDFLPRQDASCSSARTSPILPPWERIRRGLRRTYQNSLLFRNLAVIDNLYLAARGVSRGRLSLRRTAANDPAYESARELAHHARLEHVANQAVAELSHGQQRQLEIGMALAGVPRLILFDEPAAGSPASGAS
jgi:branched-chain amino acid transport system ATP-binding protein